MANFRPGTKYYKVIDKKLQEWLSISMFKMLKKGHVRSEGKTTIVTEKIQGIHKYKITESEGTLTHYIERARHDTVSFLTFFKKQNTPNDTLNITMLNFLGRRMIIKPKFKQIMAENYNSAGVQYDHVLVGVTVIRFFPFPRYSDTFYFIEDEGELVPIGFAVYKATQ
jgi:hypothetical protein